MNIDKNRTLGNIRDEFEESGDARPPDSPSFDPDDYRAELAAFDLTEEQANALLGTLWEIMKAFVELGFGVDSIHRFLPVPGDECGQRAGSELHLEDGQFVGTFGASARGRTDEEDDT